MIVMGLPCPVKREIKQSLSIPITTTESKPDRQQAVVCSTAPDQEIQQVSISSEIKDINRQHTDYSKAIQRANISSQYHTSFLNREVSVSSIPIYLLHEQCLI